MKLCQILQQIVPFFRMLYNGSLFCMINALTDARHFDGEIGRRLAEIDDDIRKAENVLRHDISFRGLLRLYPPSSASPVQQRCPQSCRHPHRTDGQHRADGGNGGRRLLTYPR